MKNALSSIILTATLLGSTLASASYLQHRDVTSSVYYTGNSGLQSTTIVVRGMALGATPPQMFHMVIREGLLLTVCGALIGLTITLALSRLLASFLFGITSTDPVTLAAACAVLAAVALLACYVPARRATKSDPALALRAN